MGMVNFFAIEGTDGSGKATQTQLLYDHFVKENLQVKTISLPQYGRPCACLVEDYKAGKFGPMLDVNPWLTSVFYIADRIDASHQIKYWLNEENIVIADRWTASNEAHQGAKCDIIGGFAFCQFITWLHGLEHGNLQIPQPRLYFILDVLPETSAKLLIKEDKELDGHEKNLQYQQKVREVYLWMAERHPNERKIIQCCRPNGALLPEYEIHEQIWDIVLKNI